MFLIGIILFLFIVLYLFNIISALIKHVKLGKYLDKMSDYIKTIDTELKKNNYFEQNYYDILNRPEIFSNIVYNNSDCLLANSKAINLFPYIYMLFPYDYAFTISHNRTIEQNYHAMRKTYNMLLDNLEPSLIKFKRSFNPIYTLKDFFLIPSKIFSWFGINLGLVPGRIISLLIWVCFYIFKGNTTNIIVNFLDWIKSLIS